jgi:hypothetical protein
MDKSGAICACAIVRDELPFIDEWLAYHRLLGVDRFFIYDDSPSLDLHEFLAPHRQYVTVLNWFGRSDGGVGQNRQLKAYNDGVRRARSQFEWICFLDIDEFISLPNYADLASFLKDFRSFGQISLPWLLFGHNGFFNDPPGFVTSSLTRRQARFKRVGNRVKSITKLDAIAEVRSAHSCDLRGGFRCADFRKRPFCNPASGDDADLPHVNHYLCRSFARWMRRSQRGYVTDDALVRPPGHDWKASRRGCLEQFVKVIARRCNEIDDKFMLQYESPVRRHLDEIGVAVGRGSDGNASVSDVLKPFSQIKDQELVVYTAISAGYDTLKRRDPAGTNFVAFLEEPVVADNWQIRPLAKCSVDPNRNAKIHKVLSHLYFPDHAYSLWIDGSVSLKVSPSALAEEYLEDFDIIVHRHPRRKCLFDEAAHCIQLGLDDANRIAAQVARYRSEGFPAKAGLFHNVVILRRHNERVRAFNELWWNEIENGSRRDQLSSVYAARKVGLKVGFFPGSPLPGRTYNNLFVVSHHAGFREWRSDDGQGSLRT